MSGSCDTSFDLTATLDEDPDEVDPNPDMLDAATGVFNGLILVAIIWALLLSPFWYPVVSNFLMS